MEEQPYNEKITRETEYNPNYGDHRICKCNHQYYRHFDTYDHMLPVGCKYCVCDQFIEDPDSNGCIKKKNKTQEVVESLLNEQDYDPGLLNNHGGGKVDWWLDYIRTIVNDSNAHWRSIIENYLE